MNKIFAYFYNTVFLELIIGAFCSFWILFDFNGWASWGSSKLGGFLELLNVSTCLLFLLDFIASWVFLELFKSSWRFLTDLGGSWAFRVLEVVIFSSFVAVLELLTDSLLNPIDLFVNCFSCFKFASSSEKSDPSSSFLNI